jgi:hypothetical protein
MIPEFDDEGDLPPGIHRATQKQFEERFVRFSRSDRRLRIYEGLARLLDEVGKMEMVKQVYVAGSYVSSKAEPNDFDCLIVVVGSTTYRTLRPLEYRLFHRPMARRAFGGDVVTVVDGSPEHDEYFAFFQGKRGGKRVGIIEIQHDS